MNDKFDFPFFYDNDRGRWHRDEPIDDSLTIVKIVTCALEAVVLVSVLVAVIMLFLCM